MAVKDGGLGVPDLVQQIALQRLTFWAQQFQPHNDCNRPRLLMKTYLTSQGLKSNKTFIDTSGGLGRFVPYSYTIIPNSLAQIKFFNWTKLRFRQFNELSKSNFKKMHRNYWEETAQMLHRLQIEVDFGAMTLNGMGPGPKKFFGITISHKSWTKAYLAVNMDQCFKHNRDGIKKITNELKDTLKEQCFHN